MAEGSIKDDFQKVRGTPNLHFSDANDHSLLGELVDSEVDAHLTNVHNCRRDGRQRHAQLQGRQHVKPLQVFQVGFDLRQKVRRHEPEQGKVDEERTCLSSDCVYL